ncbi:MAG: glycosyltransferase [Methanoculleus horonobensis]|jgi:glycosyltransferase involved in cell wall biosynthesis|nr:glycosyltransferase [Methanoculleus horonobensis]MDD4251587.1 glycosyltransferase [Methanoculleus horonobensis]MDK2917193.1 L-malate glycosyltransferase [Euryarchaeota archaeon]MDN5339022.1 L-malate glycosyltransferase [Euryarchaeota archaeon]
MPQRLFSPRIFIRPIVGFFPRRRRTALLGVSGRHRPVFSPRPCDHIRSRYGLENCFVVGHVGVLREWLDFRPLFIAIKRLAAAMNIKLLIVGGGVGYEDAVKMAKEIGVLENIVFTGAIPYSQVPEYISCMDVGIVPFKPDNVSNNSLPLKLFEYFACEVPVISTYIDTIREIFGNNVLFVSTPEDYSRMMLLLCQNPDLRKEMGRSGRKIVESSYRWSTLSKNLEIIARSEVQNGLVHA